MKITRKLLNIAVGLVLANGASAGMIVDSGPGRDAGGINVDSSQWLAQEFTLNQSYELHSIQGWIGNYVPGEVTLVLYENDSQGLTNPFFSAKFSFDERLNNWHGVDGLALTLNAGTYWAAFEVLGASTFRGYMGGESVYQVGKYAYTRDGGVHWSQQSNQGLGIRIDGDVSAVSTVPETESYSMLLVGLGLIGEVARRRKKKSMSDE